MLLLKTTLAAILLAPVFGATKIQPDQTLVVHEWGTFTSVAGEAGEPVPWALLSGPSDLPCFVHRLGSLRLKMAPGLVRLETPVLYFYPQGSMTVSIHVAFPQGWITEWYPQATKVKPETSENSPPEARFAQGRIDWDSIQLSPGENPVFPSDHLASHYYAARNTDATSLSIGGQSEKMIFYRGMGNFQAPLQAKFTNDGKLRLLNTGLDPIPAVILFENRHGNIGYQIIENLDDSAVMELPNLVGNLAELRQKVAESLVESGLYPKEAAAMIETWRDSWFEEGMRVFYILPRPFVDAQLPVRINPIPATLTRVFVGRAELLSPSTRQAIESALANGDVPILAKFGRFLDPFAAQIQGSDSGIAESAAAGEFLQQARAKVWNESYATSCDPSKPSK